MKAELENKRLEKGRFEKNSGNVIADCINNKLADEEEIHTDVKWQKRIDENSSTKQKPLYKSFFDTELNASPCSQVR